MVYLTYAFSLPVEHGPQTTCFPPPVFKNALISIFIQLYLKPPVHISVSGYFSSCTLVARFPCSVAVSAVVLFWEYSHRVFTACVQASCICFFLDVHHGLFMPADICTYDFPNHLILVTVTVL